MSVLPPRQRIVKFGRALDASENLCRPSEEEIYLESSMTNQDDDDTFWRECIQQTIGLQRPAKKYQGFRGLDEEAALLEQSDAAAAAAASSAAPATPGAPGKYVAPHLRAGAAARLGASSTDAASERDERTLRVTNLSDTVKEGDLGELFGKAGRVSRVFVAKHQDTKLCKGFAFVTMNLKSEAAKAITMLDRHPYDNLILKVEWAKPSEKK